MLTHSKTGPLLPGLQDEADAMLPNISRHASTCDRIEGVLSGLQSSSIAEVCGSLALWLSGPDSRTIWLPGCLAAWLPGCLASGWLAAWLPGCLVPGYLAAWLPVALSLRCLQNVPYNTLSAPLVLFTSGGQRGCRGAQFGASEYKPPCHDSERGSECFERVVSDVSHILVPRRLVSVRAKIIPTQPT